MRRALAAILAVTQAVSLAGIAALLGIVGWTVIGRALHDLTGGAVSPILPGGIELAQHALMLSVLAALPRAAVRGMVRVEVLAARLPAPLAAALDRLWALGFALFAAALALLLAGEAATQWARGDETQDLRLPMAWVTGTAALAALLTAAAAFLHATGAAEGEP